MKKQYLFLTLVLAFLPLYSMESTQEDVNTQLNTYVASDAFEENFLKDFNEKRIEEIAETIKGLNQCFPSLTEDNATKIQNIIRNLSDKQRKPIFEKLLEQKEWPVAVNWAKWCKSLESSIDQLINKKESGALQSLFPFIAETDPLKLKIDLAISLQPLLENEQWNEAAGWIFNHIEKEQMQALMPYINQLIDQTKMAGLLMFQGQLQNFKSNDSAKFLYNHIQLAIKDFIPQETKSTEVISNQSVQNSNNNNNDDNFRMENDNVSTQPNLYSDSNNNNEKIENKNRQTATIATSDGNIDLDATKLGILKSESETIANLLEDFQEEEHVTIPLEQITSDQFNEILSLLKTIHENKLLSNKELKEIIIKQLHEKQSEKQEVTGKEGKQEEEPATAEYSVKKLITLLKAANFLDIQLLLDCSLDLLAERLVTPDELKQFIEDPEYLSMLNQLPAQLNKKIVTKMPINYWILSNNLGIDFPYITFRNYGDNWATSITFSPDGRLLASGYFNGTVNIYAINQENQITPLKNLNDHKSSVISVVFSPNGRLLATASHDHTVKVYTIDQENNISCLTTLNQHNGPINSVAFSPDSRLIATASQDKTVKVYTIDQENNIKISTTLNHEGSVASIVFRPDGRLLASIVYNTLQTYSINKQNHIDSKIEATNEIESIVFSSDSRLFFSSYLRDVNCYEFNENNKITFLKKFNKDSWISSMALSPDNHLLASIGFAKIVTIYTINPQNNIKVLKTLDHHAGWVTSVMFSPDNRLLASASCDKTVKVYAPLQNLLTEQLLFLVCCSKNNDQSLDLNQYIHLQSILNSLPEYIKTGLSPKSVAKRSYNKRKKMG